MGHNKDDIIYDLIFSEKTEFNINISHYVSDVYDYDLFVEEIKSILRKSKVMVIEDDIAVNSNDIIWKLKVKK